MKFSRLNSAYKIIIKHFPIKMQLCIFYVTLIFLKLLNKHEEIKFNSINI